MSNVSITPGGTPNPGFGGEPLPGSETGVLRKQPVGVTDQGAITAGMALRWNVFEGGILRSEGTTSIGLATCAGLALGADAHGKVSYQFGGVADFAAAIWDAVTGQSGGLTVGATYWVRDATLGFLTATRPTTGGHFATQVGFAISATQLQLQLSSPITL